MLHTHTHASTHTCVQRKKGDNGRLREGRRKIRDLERGGRERDERKRRKRKYGEGRESEERKRGRKVGREEEGKRGGEIEKEGER